jgi:hypothetical protein
VIARCVRNTGVSLGPPQHGRYYTVRTVFHVNIGSDYLVMGMSLWETVLTVLVCDETGRPHFHPIGLFTVDIQAMPDHWEFVLLDGIAASGGDALNRRVAMWGYRELVRDLEHGDKLIDRDPATVEIFFRELAKARQRVDGRDADGSSPEPCPQGESARSEPPRS